MKLFWYNTILIILTLTTAGSKAATKDTKTNDDPDYFYDESLNQESIEKLKQEKEIEASKKRQEEDANKKKEEDPAWFIKENDPENVIDVFMKQQIDTYLKKYRKEQIEKLKSKKKSDLNHQVLSIVFVSAFFVVGTLIGLLIVFIRGHSQKMSKIFKSKSKKLTADGKNNNNSDYTPVAIDPIIAAQNNNQIVT